MTAFFYAALKFAAYSGWCWAGLRAFRPEGSSRVRAALGLGLARLLMGFFFGIGIWIVGSAAMRPLHSQLLVYLAVYVPVRWIEWAIMDVWIRPEPAGPWSFFLGADGRSRGWRARGIAISCLADIPMIVSLGGILPLGRFMC